LLQVFTLVSETIKRSLLEIFRGEEYLFEDSRGLVGRDRVKVGEPKPLGYESGLLKFFAEVSFPYFS